MEPPLPSERPVFATQGALIVVLNVWTVLVFCKKKATLKRASYLLVNLAFADTLVGIAEIFYGFGVLPFGSNREALVSFSVAASLLALSLISLERLFATWKPLRHRTMSAKCYFIAIGCVWALSLTHSAVTSFHVRGRVQLLGTSHVVVLVFSGLALCTIVVSYAAIWYAVVIRPRPVHPNREKNRQLTKTLFVVTALSLLAWMPTLVLFSVQVPRGARLAINVCMFWNSLVNPVVYIVRMPEFRKELQIRCRNCRISP